MKKVILKRKLISSFFFDCGTADNSMYMPTVAVYWDMVNKKQPFQMTVKYAWQDFTVNYPYKNTMKYLRGHSLRELAKNEITERLPSYKGKFENDIDSEFYLSEIGKSILASSSQEQVEKWIAKGQL